MRVAKTLLLALVALVALGARPALAASLQACWTTATVTTDMATVQLVADGSLVVVPDVLATDVVIGLKSCTTVPFPSTLIRGVDHAMTLRGVNAFGEVGTASAPVAFHPPLVPGVISGLSVQIVVP